MCRWLAYLGSPIYLEALLFNPEHSLIDQSRNAELSEYRTNGDGFGVGWYGNHSFPGVYRNVQPAWNDRNLRNLAAQIRSGHFLAHIRSTTGTAIQTTNCHPFRYEDWLFQHNGEINGFEHLKRDLDVAIDAELYPTMEGSTDTERLFYLALTYGLRDNPLQALRKTVGLVEDLRRKHRIKEAFYFTAAASNGSALYAVRYSSDQNADTLFHSTGVEALREVCHAAHEVPEDGMVVLSEPLDRISNHWKAVPEASFLTARGGRIQIESFEPEYP